MLLFSTKTCSCYSTKTYVDSLILSLNWIWLRWETNALKCVWCSTKTTFNVYVSQRSQIQFEDEDHAVYTSFRLVTTTLSSLRTTACDALIVPSESTVMEHCKLKSHRQLWWKITNFRFNYILTLEWLRSLQMLNIILLIMCLCLTSAYQSKFQIWYSANGLHQLMESY